MKHLTVRNIPAELSAALQAEKRRRGLSLNQVVIRLLSQSLGTDSGAVRCNGLARLAGTWTDDDLKDFEKALAVTEQIDEELWQ